MTSDPVSFLFSFTKIRLVIVVDLFGEIMYIFSPLVPRYFILLGGKEIHSRQWLALFLLFLGVAVVQLNNGKSTERAAQTEQNQFLGFGAVILACCSSGFAGVYFEKILKGWSTLNPVLCVCGCVFFTESH